MVSIIVPIYNGEKYLKQCLNSILTQSIQDFELLLVNDGSTDNSISICRKCEIEDNRVKVIDKKNAGVSSARNIGLEMARGEYISFVDCDDVLHRDYLQLLQQAIQQYEADMSICGYLSGKSICLPGQKEEIMLDESQVYDSEKAIKNVFFDEKYKELQGYVWNRMFRKDIIDNFNIRFSENMKYSEDKLFIVQYLSKCKKVVEIYSDLYFYRLDTDSATGQNMYLNYLKIDKCFYDEIYLFHYINDNINLNFDVKEIIRQWYCRIIIVRLVNYYQYRLKGSSIKDLVLQEKKCIQPLHKHIRYLKLRQKVLAIVYFSMPALSDRMLKVICKWE